jgi:hypothetical protein
MLYQNRNLWKIFGPERDEETGGLRELGSEDVYKSYSLRNIITVIKSRMVQWEW